MTHRNLITDPATILRFIMAGKAKFTVVSQKTGTRFTYKASAPKDGGKMRFVSVLNGPDNWENYQYIGFIPVRDTNGLVAGNKGRGTAPSFVALNWVLRKVAYAIANDVTEISGLEFWHEGHCAACGRLLTVPGSIALGFGPHCAAKYGIELEVDEDAADEAAAEEMDRLFTETGRFDDPEFKLGMEIGQDMVDNYEDDPRLQQAELDAEMAIERAYETNDEHREEMEREDAMYGNPYDPDERLRSWIKEQVGE